MTKKLAESEAREPDDEGRLTDLRHSDELERMRARLLGLQAAIFGACDGDDPFYSGLKRLAYDVAEAMEACADAFEAERQLRGQGQKSARRGGSAGASGGKPSRYN